VSTPTPEQTLALEIPDGTYVLTADTHRRLLTHVHAPTTFATAVDGPAHPIFAHLATHCGMGWTFNEFLAAVKATPEDGVVFGGGTFTFNRPILIGHKYVIRSVMHDVTRKVGRRVGTFDAITVALDLIDVDQPDSPAVSTTETYIVPRHELTPATSAAPEQGQPVPGWTESDGYLVGPITLEDIVGIMDVMEDTNPVHIDLELALASGYRGIVNQGPANLAFIFNAMAADRGTVTDLRHVAFTFRDTVTEGDRLEVRLNPVASGSVPPATVEAELMIVGAGLGLSCRAEFDVQ
jgi:acyl dehydratase